jgi:uncharacterized protein YkwD
MTTMRRSAVMALLLGLLASLVTFLPASPAAAATPVEYELLAKINKARAAYGIGPLVLSRLETDKVSRPWTYKMAGAARLSHNPYYVSQTSAYVTRSWTRITENVGYGPNLSTTFSAFMQSAPHRANILDRGVNWVGLGAVSKGGRLWITMNFVRSTANIVADADPFGGSKSLARTSESTVAISGWAIDPSTLGAISVQVTIDGVARTLPASGYRSDVATSYPTFGGAHGYSAVLTVAPGNHTVCVTALNVGMGKHTRLACTAV